MDDDSASTQEKEQAEKFTVWAEADEHSGPLKVGQANKLSSGTRASPVVATLVPLVASPDHQLPGAWFGR